MPLSLTSSAFTSGTPIPTAHTCDGADLSPPLQWGGVPRGTVSLALLCDDPDAPGGDWVHWVLFGIPPTIDALPQALPATPALEGIGVQGSNDFGRLGYGGPCPPKGAPHRYSFTLFALSAKLPLKAGATKAQLLAATKGKVLATATLMGTYQRR